MGLCFSPSSRTPIPTLTLPHHPHSPRFAPKPLCSSSSLSGMLPLLCLDNSYSSLDTKVPSSRKPSPAPPAFKGPSTGGVWWHVDTTLAWLPDLVNSLHLPPLLNRLSLALSCTPSPSGTSKGWNSRESEVGVESRLPCCWVPLRHRLTCLSKCYSYCGQPLLQPQAPTGLP